MDLVCFRNAPRVRARLRQLGHVPEHLLDELTADVIARALSASFDQSTPGQFFSWLDTIVKRTRADFFRAPKQRTGLDAEGLAEEHEGEDDFRLAQGWEDFPYGRVEAADVVQRALDSLENDRLAPLAIATARAARAIAAAPQPVSPSSRRWSA